MQEYATVSLCRDAECLDEINQVCSHKGQLLNKISLMKKKERDSKPLINLKESNQHIPFLHFKMKSFQYLKTLLHKNKHSCKLDLKDT